MLKDYVVAETVTHFHLVRAEEDIIETAIKNANESSARYNTGYEAIEAMLENYSGDYFVMPNFCGTEIDNIELIDEK